MKLSFAFCQLLLFVVFSQVVKGQDMPPVRLKHEKKHLAVKSYYVSEVTDSTANPNVIGVIMKDGSKQPITMKGSTAGAIKDYIDNNIDEHKSAQAVSLNVTKMNFKVEKKGNLWQINADMVITIYAGGIKLMGYENNGLQQVDTLTDAGIDEFIRSTISQDMRKFDVWWPAHKNEFPVSQQVVVNVNMGKSVSMPECIVYNAKRPLSIGDFKGKVQNDSAENAVTFSGMTFLQAVSVTKGQLVVNLTITPYFDRANSWFKVGEGSKILLAHEQGHFDITAIVACELVTELKHAAFTKDNYATRISEIEHEYDQKRNDEQNAYDRETNHSKIADKQLEWQQKLTEQIKILGCY